jgi:hypothetical protein
VFSSREPVSTSLENALKMNGIVRLSGTIESQRDKTGKKGKEKKGKEIRR